MRISVRGLQRIGRTIKNKITELLITEKDRPYTRCIADVGMIADKIKPLSLLLLVYYYTMLLLSYYYNVAAVQL